MPHFLGGHICPKISRSFPVSVLGTSGSVRRGSSMVPLVQCAARDWGGPWLKVAGRQLKRLQTEPGLWLPAPCSSLGIELQRPELGCRTTPPF